MSGTFSINGLATGFDTAAIVDATMAVERRGVTLLEARQARANTQLAAFRALNTKLLAFQTSARTLSRSTAFGAKTVSVSDETILTATATSGAAAGAYAVRVNALARAHQLACQGFADTDSTTVGTGEIQIQVGDGETETVEVTTANNTLAGLRDAINQADAGVTASIINDGSDAVPYRLLLTADETGTDNTIAITLDLTGGPSTTPSWIDNVRPDAGNVSTYDVASHGTFTGATDKSYVIEITKNGTLANSKYRISEDGGSTWGNEHSFGGIGTIDVYDDKNGVDLGVDVTFQEGDFSDHDLLYVDAYVARSKALTFSSASVSDAVADSGNSFSGTIVTEGPYTGSTNKAYVVEIVEGGIRSDATYRISEDGGATWGSTQAFSGGTIDVYDDLNGTDLGVDAIFEYETFGAGDRFTIDAFVPTVQEAADAELVVGSGDGQIAVTSSSNAVTGVLAGVTLNLQKADAGETVEIAVENDTSTAEQNIRGFVDNYNGVVDFIRDQTRYDPETNEAGVLLGNTSVLKIQRNLREAVLGTVPGLEAGYDGLYAIGVTVSTTGKLSIDSSDLADALENHLDAVARLFQASGESTHSKIAFVSATDDTESNAAGYTVHITQAAARGALTGASITDPAVSGLTIDETNDKLVLEVNGVGTSVLSLSHKTYASGTELASEVAAKIADSENAVAPVDVVFVDEGATGYFEIRTEGYGSGYSVELGEAPSNSAHAVLGLADGTSTEGQDVAGTIDGFEAEGSGRLLKAVDANSPAQGLWLEVTLEPDEVGGGVDAVVSVVKGVGKQARDVLDYLTDPLEGYVKSKEDRYTSQIERYAAQIERKEELLAKRRERLVARFVRLEQAISSLQSQSSFLSAQLSSLTSLMTQSSSS